MTSVIQKIDYGDDFSSLVNWGDYSNDDLIPVVKEADKYPEVSVPSVEFLDLHIDMDDLDTINLISGMFHSSQLDIVDRDFTNDLRVNLPRILSHLDWICSNEHKFGSFIYACNLEDRDYADERSMLIKNLALSRHWDKIAVSMGDYYDDFRKDLGRFL